MRPEMTVTLPNPQTHALQPDDDLLLDDGLPCLRRDGKLYYLGDVQPRVLEACRHFEIGFEQLSEKLGLPRPALVLILKGYDAVPPALKNMIDRLVVQAGLLQPATSYCAVPADLVPANEPDGESQDDARADSAAGSPTESAVPVVTTIHAVRIPDQPRAENDATEIAAAGSNPPPVTAMVEEVVIPDVVALDRPGAPHLVVPDTVPEFTPGLAGFTPGLRRSTRRRAAPKRGQFLLT